jgi:hypothetical protein
MKKQKEEQEQEQLVPKEWDVFYYDMNRTTVMVEKPKDLSLVTSQDLANLQYRTMKIQDILLAWPKKLQDLNIYQIRDLEIIKEEEFIAFRTAVRWWKFNIHHDALYPTLSKILNERVIPGRVEIDMQGHWKKLVDPVKLDSLILADDIKAGEIIMGLQDLKEKEERYELHNI